MEYRKLRNTQGPSKAAREQHEAVSHCLVSRYMRSENSRRTNSSVSRRKARTMRQDIASLRHELTNALQPREDDSTDLDKGCASFQAVQVDNILYVSGMIGTDSNSKLVEGGISEEAKTALTHMGNVLAAAGTSFDKVVKTTVLLADLNDFAVVNDIYRQYFKEPYPARMAYQVAKLPLGAKIEIDAIAVVGEMETLKSTL